MFIIISKALKLKMFLIECSADNSLLILEENYAICDVATVKSGDVINFFYNKKRYEGKILMHSGKIIINFNLHLYVYLYVSSKNKLELLCC